MFMAMRAYMRAASGCVYSRTLKACMQTIVLLFHVHGVYVGGHRRVCLFRYGIYGMSVFAFIRHENIAKWINEWSMANRFCKYFE